MRCWLPARAQENPRHPPPPPSASATPVVLCAGREGPPQPACRLGGHPGSGSRPIWHVRGARARRACSTPMELHRSTRHTRNNTRANPGSSCGASMQPRRHHASRAMAATLVNQRSPLLSTTVHRCRSQRSSSTYRAAPLPQHPSDPRQLGSGIAKVSTPWEPRSRPGEARDRHSERRPFALA